MDSPTLTSPGAADFVKNGKDISTQFGDYFIRGVATGGRFFGVVRIETKDADSKSKIDAALSGSYGLTISADVKTTLSQHLREFSSRSEAFVWFEGGQVQTHPTSNDPVALLDQLFQAMKEWSAMVKAGSKVYMVTVAPYSIALGPTPPNVAELEKQRGVLIRCAKLRSQTMDKLNTVEYILDSRHTDEFNVVAPRWVLICRPSRQR